MITWAAIHDRILGIKDIDESMKLEIQWYAEAKVQTVKTLPKFINRLIYKYNHDYGTICNAITAAGLGAMQAVNHDPKQGGITGAQAGFILWGMVREWLYKDNKIGLRLIDYDKLLYPQYAEHFKKSITALQWSKLQAEARKLVAANGNLPHAHPRVYKHWKTIVAGKIPFGYKIAKED